MTEAPVLSLRPPAGPIPRPSRTNLRGLAPEALQTWTATALGGPRYRADQLWDWIHAARVTSFESMTNLSRADRARLGELGSVDALEVAATLRSEDGTQKLRLRTADGASIEAVLIPNDDRGNTLCVSSQVGCALTCRFCATASLTFRRHLDTWEIVDQFYRAAELLTDRDEGDPQRRITNLVFMGMGEPLLNYERVRRAISILTHPRGAGLGSRRITISTAGVVPAIERFARDELGKQVGLAISLNATTDALRDEIMPINRRWPIAMLLAAVSRLPAGARRDATFEYVLLAGVNDSPADARRLIGLVGHLHCHVNVIPFNPHAHAPYRRPSDTAVTHFVEILRNNGVSTYLRTPRGDDIAAACGQLALQKQQPRP